MSIRKIFVCEDHTIIIEGLKLCIEQYSDFEMVGYSQSGTEAVIKIEASQPDILILDLNLKDTDGFYEDDGIGFDANSTNGGLGLTNMQLRAESMGGILEISSSAEKGTVVIVSVPLIRY